MSFPEMLAKFASADVVVTHAGVRSILLATNAGHVPIVVPRLKDLGEHVDDHQMDLIREGTDTTGRDGNRPTRVRLAANVSDRSLTWSTSRPSGPGRLADDIP